MPKSQTYGKRRTVDLSIFGQIRNHRAAMGAAGQDTPESAAKIRSWQEQQKDFVKQTGLKRQSAREQIAGTVGKKPVASGGGSGIIKSERQISNRKMSNGWRGQPNHVLTNEEIERIKTEIQAIKAGSSIFRFNQGRYTGYNDERDYINVRGDILPDIKSSHPRDKMSVRAVIAHEHEYYGHRAYRNTEIPKGAWNDEFRASYMAAKNTPNLTDEDRYYLVLDAIERAKEAGISIKNNTFIRRVLYGY